MVAKITENIQAISHLMHVSKPVIVELALFVWGLSELLKWLYAMLIGG